MNDPGALDALMAQFGQERDPDTRRKLAEALGKNRRRQSGAAADDDAG